MRIDEELEGLRREVLRLRALVCQVHLVMKGSWDVVSSDQEAAILKDIEDVAITQCE